MKPEQLIEYFDRISEAPDAVTRLRRFILDLAVRGKLVEQDPNDEPAEQLLKRVYAEKARLVNEGGAKKEKALSPIEKDELPFSVPKTWTWVRLQDITSYIQRGKSPVYATDEGLPVVSQKCVQWSGLDLSVARRITSESIKKYEEVRFLRENDLLWNSTGTGTIGRVVRVVEPPDKLVCDSHVTVVRCALVNAEYVRSWLISDHVYRLIEDRAAGSTNQVELTAQMATAQVVPLPPLAEQHRIVAKVDELMALCDQLEAAKNEREAQRDRLVAASLHRIGTAHAAADEVATEAQNVTLLRDAARFHLDHLPRLTTRPEHIKQLRQTILDLAVRGRLVPQDPKDEPAAKLLNKIQNEKDQLIKEKKIRKQQPLPSIDPDNEPFVAPSSWVWCRLGNICFVITDGAHHTPKYETTGVAFLSVKDVSSGVIDFSNTRFISEEAHRELCKRCKPEFGDILLTKVGTTGIAVTIDVEKEFSIFVSLALLKFSKKNIDRHFLKLLINSPFVKRQSAENTQGIGNKNLVLRLINQFSIPLPPLAEQHRIVAKVDELMALCDQLEAQLTTTQTDSRRLLEAVLHEALSPIHEEVA